MSNIPNFLEEEEYDRPTTEAAPNFGEPGFGKGKTNARKGTPRARITELDARLLAFIGHFPGSDTEALSLLNIAQASNLGNPSGSITSVTTTERRLAKLKKLGAVERYRQSTTGAQCYSLTGLGFSAARDYGYNMDHGRSLSGIAESRLTHYRMIALVAAQLASPAGFFRDSLGIEPVELEQLISENAMRAAYEPIKADLAAAKKDGKSADFGKWRAEKLAAAVGEVKEERIAWSDLVEVFPVLWTLGHPQRDGTKAKPVHQPDLAVNLDADRADHFATNLFVEIELSRKDWDEYDRILATFAAELARPYIYRRGVYFVIGTQVETLLKKIDEAGGYNLISSGKLIVRPLTHRDGSLVAQKKRITLGGTR
ncbi:protein involved in plasmid replication-relaxation [Curtobacterium sp. PhB130]|uniref:replication-relaxation family protein n=1 Tax=Curtobacterium sp. PhB130 TaxID=2485178 RepID=UPI000F4BDE24|nr:replication-relaxation family protein [Curtobacterium sp. PhB130]ROS77944.1 protein involved in plasmid replication-relaxation [Curtobacterium sp. PhB130]